MIWFYRGKIFIKLAIGKIFSRFRTIICFNSGGIRYAIPAVVTRLISRHSFTCYPDGSIKQAIVVNKNVIFYL